MFDPMFPDSNGLDLVLLAIAVVLFLAGMYWIHRISKDIEDN